MNIVYDNENVTVYYIPTSKFKNNVLDIYFCDKLDKETAYMNALIPRILERGSVKYPSMRIKTKFLKKMYGASSYTGADTAGEIHLTNYTLDYVDGRYIRSNDYDEDIETILFEYVIDQITNPVVEDYDGTIGFKEEYFYQEVKRQNEQIENIINDKQQYAYNCLCEEMCKDEPYSVYYLGAVEDSKGLTPQYLYQYYKNHYLKNLSIKIFYSSSSSPDKLINILKSCPVFTEAKTKAVSIGYKEVTSCDVKEIQKAMDVTQGKLVMGYRTNVDPSSDDYYALMITNGIFGNGTQSKLFRNVREANSLAYYAYSSTRRFKGLLFASSGIDVSNKEAAQKLIIQQLEDVKNGKISDDELNAAKNGLGNYLNSQYDTQYSLIDFYLSQSFLDIKIHEPAEFKERINKVTKEECARIAQNIVLDTIFFLTSKD